MALLPIAPATLTAIVIALSFAIGLNVYATIFFLGLMARLHWLVLPAGLHILGDLPVVIAAGVMFSGQLVADKIPGFDLIWNALHTFVRIPVAALLAYGVGEHLSPEMHVLVTCLGALIAAIAHGSKTAMRVAVTPSPEPISNVALSTTEDGIAIGLTALVMHHPLAAGASALTLTVGCVTGIWVGFRAVKKAWGGMFNKRRGPLHTI